MAQDGRGSRPGRPPGKAGANPNTRLLLWRLVLAILLTLYGSKRLGRVGDSDQL